MVESRSTAENSPMPLLTLAEHTFLAEERNGEPDQGSRLRGLVKVVGFIRWLVFGGFGKNLRFLIRV